MRMGFDLDPRDDAFHVAPVIEQRREACPALLAHTVAFIEDHNTAHDHRADERRCDVAKAAFALDDRRDQQIFRSRIHGRLHDEDVTTHPLRCGIGQRGLADAGFADQPRIHRNVELRDDHPGGQQLPH